MEKDANVTMADIRLKQLPDRAPVKLTISISPDLHRSLADYAVYYAQIYGCEEPVQELIPAMLSGFIQSDRAFLRNQRKS